MEKERWMSCRWILVYVWDKNRGDDDVCFGNLFTGSHTLTSRELGGDLETMDLIYLSVLASAIF